MTLVEFLLARIAEDELVARSIQADPHLVAKTHGLTPTFWRSLLLDRGYANVQKSWLAECEAKRRIVVEFVDGGTDDLWGPEIGALLALPYADHPDYDEAWRP